MNKDFLSYILVIIFFTACAPQVTVTPDATVTLPSIPTPTLHPQMSALREKITASGDRFMLDVADGRIYDGETPIPGLTVAPDGTITLTVNGESVTLDPADVDFDDETGISIDGYEWDPDANDGAGAWVVAESVAMQQTTALIDQYNIDPEAVTVTEEGGAVNVIVKETGTVLIRTIGENSKFDLGFAVDTIAKSSCEPKPEFVPSSRGLMLAENGDAPSRYFDEIRAELNFQSRAGSKLWHVLIDREHRCWGEIINDGTDLIYRDVDGVSQRVSLIGLSKADIEAFISDR